MLLKDDLQQMREADILKAAASGLAELDLMAINPSLPIERRFDDYIKKNKNPYAFMYGGVKVKINFSDSERTLDKGLIRYFSHLKKT